MYTSIAVIHQTGDQPLPIVGRFDHKTLELIGKRAQRLKNDRTIIGHALFENALEVWVHYTDISIS
jgi:hypothetical protein